MGLSARARGKEKKRERERERVKDGVGERLRRCTNIENQILSIIISIF